MFRKGGYIIVDLTSGSLYTDLQDAIASQKPILLVDGDHTPIYASSVVADATTITINETLVVANDNTTTGSLDFNVKPLYFHPLTIYNDDFTIGATNYGLVGSATILDNDDTQFTTLEDVKDYMVGKFTRLNTSLTLYDKTNSVAIEGVQLYVTADGNHIYVIGYDMSGAYHTESLNQIDLISVASGINVLDDVNKIN